MGTLCDVWNDSFVQGKAGIECASGDHRECSALSVSPYLMRSSMLQHIWNLPEMRQMLAWEQAPGIIEAHQACMVGCNNSYKSSQDACLHICC